MHTLYSFYLITLKANTICAYIYSCKVHMGVSQNDGLPAAPRMG